jgi:hypothetical protein
MKSILALAILLPMAGCGYVERQPEYRYPDVAAITAQFHQGHWQNADWEFVETLGTTRGPFKGVGDHQSNKGSKKSVTYTVGGSRVKKVLEIDEAVLVRRFVNPQGDWLLMIYKHRPVKDKAREV